MRVEWCICCCCCCCCCWCCCCCCCCWWCCCCCCCCFRCSRCRRHRRRRRCCCWGCAFTNSPWVCPCLPEIVNIELSFHISFQNKSDSAHSTAWDVFVHSKYQLYSTPSLSDYIVYLFCLRYLGTTESSEANWYARKTRLDQVLHGVSNIWYCGMTMHLLCLHIDGVVSPVLTHTHWIYHSLVQRHRYVHRLLFFCHVIHGHGTWFTQQNHKKNRC